jgi:Fe-S-cluster-containing hydrogenase component 2
MAGQLDLISHRCTGCMQCELACSFVQTGSFQPSQSLIRVHIFDEQATYTPYTCPQCDEAWCMQACPTNAIAIHPDTGAKVVIDQACVGCAVCTIACPFGTIFFGHSRGVASKCDLCGGDPACALACPTGAIRYGEADAAAWLTGLVAAVDRADEGRWSEPLGGASSAAPGEQP